MADLKQLKCPSCGAILNQSFPNQLIVECPYCHQQVVNETFQSSGKDNEPRVLEFSMTEKEVVEQMVNLLIDNKDVPTDIFDKMKITSIEKYYVPMYIFEGTFRAPWTAERARQEKRQRTGRDGKIEDYYETLYDYYNGEATGNFSVNGIPSNELTRLNLNSDSTQGIVVNPSQLSLFSKIQINSNDNIEILTPSSEGDSVWWESGEGAAQRVGIGTAHSQTPDRVTSCSVSCELKKTSFVYIPLWIIQYDYNDDMFSSVFYAEQYMHYNHPNGEIIEAQPTEEQQFVLNKYNKRDSILDKTGNYGCWFFVLVGFIGCLGINKYQSNYNLKHYLDSDFNRQFGDDLIFLLYMVFAGIALIIIISIIQTILRRKDGIDNIKEDIADRTRFLQNKADNYRKNTGEAFLKHFSGYSRKSFVAQEMNNFSKDVENEESYENLNISPLYAASTKSKKFCSHCGKEIDGTHKFCRYCGAKL